MALLVVECMNRELYDAIMADPDTLWVVVSTQPGVAGPWVHSRNESWRNFPNQDDSYPPAARLRGSVQKRAGAVCPDGHEQKSSGAFCSRCGKPSTRRPAVYVWRVDDLAGSFVHDLNTKVFASRDEAACAADDLLRKKGWLLASEAP